MDLTPASPEADIDDTTVPTPSNSVPSSRVPRLKRKASAPEAKPAPVRDPLPQGRLQRARLSDIVLEGRARKDMGDLKGLARSLAEVGLVQPPLLDAQMRLVSGHRRLEAARLLGWKEITVRVLDIEDPTALAVAEDANRKPLNASEKFAVCSTLKRRARDEAWRRSAFGGRLDAAAEKGAARLDEAIARAVGLSRETLRKISAIHAAAEEDRAKFGSLVEQLNEDGRVDRHYRALERLRGRGDGAPAAALIVAPGWRALHEKAEARDVARYVRDSLLAAGADEGTLLLFPSGVEALAEAAGLARQGGLEWRATLRGSGAAGEELWLVAVGGSKATLADGALEILAEGCAKGADAAMESATAATGGEARLLDLVAEAAR